VFCQLEALRHCLPPSVRLTLEELPESLDETYERILKEIKKPNKRLARRVLQCLVVAIRPLRVAELAEVLAVDFDDAEGIPRSKPDWRWVDQEQALLSACSSLIAIVEAGRVVASDGNSDAEASDSDSEAEGDDGNSHVEAGDSRIVQFSHFSVKEFLTSSRLATASGEVSNYHIDLEPAHTILGQACLGVLLQIQYDVEGHAREDHPLVRYAAEHWTTHAQFGEVLSSLQKGTEYLFDPDKPHFRVWLTLYDIDTVARHGTSSLSWLLSNNKSPAAPLYYAALCGFHDLVEHLISKYPQDVNADGGYYMRPLLAALTGEHFQTADLLRQNGADPHVQGPGKNTPLHSAANCLKNFGHIKVVQKLIEYDADINAENMFGSTPLHWASRGHRFKDGSILRLLLKHGGYVNARDHNGLTSLHEASENGALEVVRLLLEYGADVEAKDDRGRTALQVASENRHDEVVKFLRERGAK
jgi:ankyrin repeat protein